MKAYLIINGEKMTLKSLFGSGNISSEVYRSVAEARDDIETWADGGEARNIVELEFFNDTFDRIDCVVRIVPKKAQKVKK